MSLTENEKDVLLNGIGNNDYLDDLSDPIWSDSIQDSCQVVSQKQISGVISSLVKKGLVGSNGESVWLTGEGIDALNYLRAPEPPASEWDTEYPDWNAWAAHQDNLGQIDALMCHIAKTGDKYQRERMEGIVGTFIKRLQKIDQEIED